MPVVLGNRIKVSTSTTGTGTITLGSAENGFQTFAAGGISNGDTVRYVIEDGANFEIGTGTYTASGTTLTRSVTESSNADAAINLSGGAIVIVANTTADIVTDVNITGGSISGITDLAVADGGTGASTAASARTNLGAAPLASPAFTGNPTAPTPAIGDNDTSIATTAFVRDIIPSGVIVMWSGAISAIPSGWVICDGNNSTPNLTGRFIVHADADAAGTYAPGDTGGSNSTTLAEANLPAHTHAAGNYAVGAHTHGVGNYAVGAHTHTDGTYAVASHTHGAGNYAVGAHAHGVGTYSVLGHVHNVGNFAVSSHSHGVGNLAGGAHQHGAFSNTDVNQQLIVSAHAHDQGNLSAAAGGDHSHNFNANTGAAGSHNHTGSTGNVGNHTHSLVGTFSSGNGIGLTSTQNTARTTGAGGSHAHNMSLNSNGSHSHNFNANTGNSGNHTHTVSGNTGNAAPNVTGATENATVSISGNTAANTPTLSGSSGNSTAGLTGSSDNATPTFAGDSGGTAPDVTGASGSTTPTFTGSSASTTPSFSGNSGSVGSGTSLENRPLFYALAYIMKT
jgi:hypothetical protein